MLRPSYSELMDSIRRGDGLDARVPSRYTVVLAAAKRARQITDGANPLTYAPTDRAVSIAVKEMNEGKLRIKVQEDMLDGSYERMIKDQYRYRNISVTALSKDDLREDLKENYDPVYTASTDDDDTVMDDFDRPYVEETEDIAGVVLEEKEDFDIYGDDGDEPEGGELDE